MKFLIKMAVLSVFAFAVVSAQAADSELPRMRGAISGAIVSANTGRMIAMPIAPGIKTNVNTTSNAPNVAAILPGETPTEIDFCKPPYFNKDKCCAGPNPPAYICEDAKVDYCKAPNFDYKKCCAGPKPPVEICGGGEIDYCRAPNYDYEKCCTGPNPDPIICEKVDFCRGTYFNKEKCCALPNPPVDICGEDPCGEIIPALGVDKCVAEQACSSIRANDYQGIFDIDTLQCLIPVVAHNWSGIIKADGKPVMAYVPMGNIFKCEAKSFEQIRYMRRTSQWVVPVMIVGGAGIGAGVGAIIDHYDNKKAEKFKEEVHANQDPDGRKYFTVSGGETVVNWGDRTYTLPGDRAALIDALGLKAELIPGPGRPESLQAIIDDAKNNVNACVAQMFRELVSPKLDDVSYKFGRIKITSGDRLCNDGDGAEENLLFCQIDSASPMNTNVKCPSSVKVKGTPFGQSIFHANGTCYFRDGAGPVSAAANADATASYDWYRAHTINQFLTKSEFAEFGISQSLKAAGCVLDGDDIKETMSGGRSRTALENIMIKCQKTFGEAVKGGIGVCNQYELNNTAERLAGAYAIIQVLKDQDGGDDSTVEPVDTTNLEAALASIAITGDAVVTVTDAFDERVDRLFGEKRPFFQTGVGRGLLIGTGVGILGGLGYYFAEGASVFCNVGGLDQTKLGKYFSIPSFREYIVRYGFAR